MFSREANSSFLFFITINVILASTVYGNLSWLISSLIVNYSVTTFIGGWDGYDINTQLFHPCTWVTFNLSLVRRHRDVYLCAFAGTMEII